MESELELKRPPRFLVFLERRLGIPVPPSKVIRRGNVSQLFAVFSLNGDPSSLDDGSGTQGWKEPGWWKNLPGMR